MKRLLLSLSAAATSFAVAPMAQAATFVFAPGSAATFAAPAGGVTVDFNGATLPAGFTRTGGSLVTGNLANIYQQPAFSDGSQYLTVGAGGLATLTSSVGYRIVSLYLGSVDPFNTIELLSGSTVIGTFTGSTLLPGANGTASGRITFTAAATDPAITGLRFSSSQNALETDNVAFLAAVPEPSTWAMMLLGFGAVGYSMRRRRANSALSFAV